MFGWRTSASNQADVRALILAGLADHWGSVDPTLNPDLDDMMTSYRAGRTVVIRDDGGSVIGTGTLARRTESVAEIVRMSVARSDRRRGTGRRIVDELMGDGCGDDLVPGTKSSSLLIDRWLAAIETGVGIR